MRSSLRIISVALVVCLCAASLAGCGNGIKGSEAKAFINDFFAAIVAEDYEKAEGFLHPERPADLEAFFLSVEKSNNVDFQAGIEIEKYTGFSSSLYDGTVDGSTYALSMRAKVGDQTANFAIEIVKNENGYGIYNLDLNL